VELSRASVGCTEQGQSQSCGAPCPDIARLHPHRPIPDGSRSALAVASEIGGSVATWVANWQFINECNAEQRLCTPLMVSQQRYRAARRARGGRAGRRAARERCRGAAGKKGGGYSSQKYLLAKGPGLCRGHAFPVLEFWKFLGATAPIFPSRPRRYLSVFFWAHFPEDFFGGT
jgi:hypothetical protein